jgi:hypothetical protein
MKSRHPLRGGLQNGGILIMFALTIPVLLGFAGVAIDLARIVSAKSELQSAVNASALAGVKGLIGAPTGSSNQVSSVLAPNYDKSEAYTRATVFLKGNAVDGYFPYSTRSDASVAAEYVALGLWKKGSDGNFFFEPLATGSSFPASADGRSEPYPAVKVNASLDLNLFLLPMFGLFDTTIQAQSVAVVRAQAVNRSSIGSLKPIMLSKCFWDFHWRNGPPSGTIQVNLMGGQGDQGCVNSKSVSDWTAFNETGADNLKAFLDGSKKSPSTQVLGSITNQLTGLAVGPVKEGLSAMVGNEGKERTDGGVTVVLPIVTGVGSTNNAASSTIAGYGAMKISYWSYTSGQFVIKGYFLPGYPAVDDGSLYYDPNAPTSETNYLLQVYPTSVN